MTNPAALASQRCFHHPAREAVCRCLGCSRYFCRECVVDHEGKLTCVSCLNTADAKVEAGPGRFRFVREAMMVFVGFVLVWFFFSALGRLLLMLPATMDEWVAQ